MRIGIYSPDKVQRMKTMGGLDGFIKYQDVLISPTYNNITKKR